MLALPSHMTMVRADEEVIGLMDYVNSFAVRAFLMMNKLRDRSGQGALEYIAIVVGLVVLVYAGFSIAGVNIKDEASSFVCKVTGGSGC